MSVENTIDNQGKVKAILKERGSTHGNYEAQSTFSDLLLAHLMSTPNWDSLSPPQKDCLRMWTVKVSRTLHGDCQEIDHWVDMVGYTTLVVEIMERVKEG